MSGNVGDGGDGNQVVVFVISGKLSDELKALWNKNIDELKKKFTFQLHAVTLQGVMPPEEKIKPPGE